MFISRIIHVKVGWRLNVSNKFRVQRRLSNRLATVMFLGTPCICHTPPEQTKKLEWDPSKVKAVYYFEFFYFFTFWDLFWQTKRVFRNNINWPLIEFFSFLQEAGLNFFYAFINYHKKYWNACKIQDSGNILQGLEWYTPRFKWYTPRFRVINPWLCF